LADSSIGFLQALRALSSDEAEAYAKRSSDSWAGLEQSQEVLQWIEEKQLSAVVADNPSFEVFRGFQTSGSPLNDSR